MNTEFQNRESELRELLKLPCMVPMVTVYGEAGIGKTRLLRETIQQLQHQNPNTVVLWIDGSDLVHTAQASHEALLHVLITQAKKHLSIDPMWTTVDQGASKIVQQLNKLGNRIPVFLMFDNTEALQDNRDFWRWLERHIVGPLVVEGLVKLIFAGRIPPPWRRIEIRRALDLLQLASLQSKEARDALIREVLTQEGSALDEHFLDQSTNLVNKFAFGHPRLSEKIAEYIATHRPESFDTAFQQQVCREVIKPFINKVFFAGIESPWTEWLWPMSVLDWFDTTILQAYLGRLFPKDVKNKPDYYFIQEIGNLRMNQRVLWREAQGDCLYGVIGDIIAQCLKTLDPDEYKRAQQAAQSTFQAIATQFEDDPEAQQEYKAQARAYAEDTT
jgi:hypothetical protein